MTLDSVGGLYLAYDLLGGENGPLSRIFRIVNYSVLVILVFWFPMGLGFAIVAGLALGTALALHVERGARGLPESNRFLLCMGLIRATGLSLATCVNKHYLMAAILFPFVVAATIILPKFKLSPTTIYHPGKRPVLRKNQVILAAVLGISSLAFGWLSAGIAGSGAHAAAFATRVGFTFAFAVIFVSSMSPLIEWYADNLPPKSFGYVGAVMFMLGFLVQAVPSMLAIIEP